jgi:hypothetical protein
MTALAISLLTLLGAGSFQPGPVLPKPWIQRVHILADTVWFEGERGYDSLQVRYCFSRRTGEWCRRPRRGSAEQRASWVPRGRGDRVSLAPGLALVCRPPIVAAGDCETFGVRADGDTTLYALVPRASKPVLSMLQQAAQIETDQPPSISELVTSWAAADDAIWFGLGGGFPEGYGTYGALLRFDRTRRTVETVIHAGLADATVTGLAVDGDNLWVGTFHPAEYGPVGATGVLCQNLRTRRWTTLDSAGAWLPDKVVQTLAAHDGMLYIATQHGLAVFDTRTGRSSVRYFRRATVAGSIEYVLSATRLRD